MRTQSNWSRGSLSCSRFGAGLLLCVAGCSSDSAPSSGTTTSGTTATTGGASGAATTGATTTTGAATTTSTTGGASGAGGAGGAATSGTAGSGGSAGASGSAGAGGSIDAGGSTDAGGDSASPVVDAASLARFSFFVTSLKAMRDLSGNQNGFGGDLRFGKADGLSGADEVCRQIAERSMPGSSAKQWRAFLSVNKGPNGTPVNAIDRIGTGPWYDRRARLFAMNKAALLHDRPEGADALIINDLPNEDGVPNHNPDSTGQVDNHDVLTGSNTMGNVINATGTCKDWTSATMNDGKPRCGHAWPRAGSGVNWISSLEEGGCLPGVNLVEMGGPREATVGSGGGYGGIYCFALAP